MAERYDTEALAAEEHMRMNVISPEKPKAAVSVDEIERRLEMQHLQAIEGNRLSADQIAVFEMFESEGWSLERQLTYLHQ